MISWDTRLTGERMLLRKSMIKFPAPDSLDIEICDAAYRPLPYFLNQQTIKILEGIGAPFMLGIGLLLLWWITGKAGGLGPVLSSPSKFHSGAEFFKFFIPSLTGMVGFWATVALNIPDFTRYAKSQKAQIAGQALGLPAATVTCSGKRYSTASTL